jgi:hypothetical protein
MKSVMQPYVRKVHRERLGCQYHWSNLQQSKQHKKARSMTYQDYIELNAEKYQKHDRNTLIKMIENKLAERMGLSIYIHPETLIHKND